MSEDWLDSETIDKHCAIIYERSSQAAKDRIMVFNSCFGNKLSNNGDDPSVRYAFNVCKNWFAPPNDRLKPKIQPTHDTFCFVTNYEKNHWVLYMIYKPYCNDWKREGYKDDTCIPPLMFVFDSIAKTDSCPIPTNPNEKKVTTHSQKARQFCIFLNMLHDNPTNVKIDETRGYVRVRVPQQTDGINCGIYSLLFLQHLLASNLDELVRTITEDHEFQMDERRLIFPKITVQDVCNFRSSYF